MKIHLCRSNGVMRFSVRGFVAAHLFYSQKGGIPKIMRIDATITETDGYIFLEEANDALLLKYKGDALDPVLPESCNGKPYDLPPELFFGRGIRSVTIPVRVTHIGKAAFFECSRLENIVYTGTKKQWKAVRKDRDWATGVGTDVVHCKNGDVALDETPPGKRRFRR